MSAPMRSLLMLLALGLPVAAAQAQGVPQDALRDLGIVNGL